MVFNVEPLKSKYQHFFKDKISFLKEKNHRLPKLAVVLVGDNPASLTYISSKKRLCEELGMDFELFSFPDSVSSQELKEKINFINEEESISGVIIQLPLSKHLDSQEILNTISPKKDVDGLTAYNMGLLASGRPHFIPCTPLGILKILEYAKIPLEGRCVTVIGRSNLVGRPLATLLSQPPYNATVTLAHSKTLYLDIYTKRSSLVIVAVGSPFLLKEEMILEGTSVIDVGINRDKEGKLLGDVDFEKVSPKCHFITPVPKGVGVMTVLMLIYNTIRASYEQQGLEFSLKNPF